MMMSPAASMASARCSSCVPRMPWASFSTACASSPDSSHTPRVCMAAVRSAGGKLCSRHCPASSWICLSIRHLDLWVDGLLELLDEVLHSLWGVVKQVDLSTCVLDEAELDLTSRGDVHAGVELLMPADDCHVLLSLFRRYCSQSSRSPS